MSNKKRLQRLGVSRKNAVSLRRGSTHKLSILEKNLRNEYTEVVESYKKFLKNFKTFQVDNVSSSFSEDVMHKKLEKAVGKGIGMTNSSSQLEEDVLKFLQILLDFKVERISYSAITMLLFDVRAEDQQDFEVFLQAVDKTFADIIQNKKYIALTASSIADREKAIFCFYKIHEHTKLANKQFDKLYLDSEHKLSSLNKLASTTNERLDELQKLQATLKESIKNSKKDIDALEKRYEGMNMDIIAVLGVFSAFVFVMFGGFSALSEILENLSNRNVSLGSTLLMVGTLVWVILTIIYSMLYWISLFTGKNTLVPKHYWQLSAVCGGIFLLSVFLHWKGI